MRALSPLTGRLYAHQTLEPGAAPAASRSFAEDAAPHCTELF